jgi:serine/threonine protein kinase
MSAEKPLVRELTPRAHRLCQSRGWTLHRSLGAGVTAAVFDVLTPEGLRALKLYSPRYLRGKAGETVRRRFEMVLKHLGSHDCPHLITVHEGGETDGTLFMLMQRAPGHCLGEVLKLVPRAKIREIVRQVAVAAHYLEQRDFCHRDIKADNVVVSDDFGHAMLLDLGVVRWLDDEIGAGTDESGQLPFVATARYSSPEYMFRLVKPGPELWRGLTFYQLGGLLHHLITQERLFEDVVRQASENRYLIAHAVATREPTIRYDVTVPLDLVLLAQRALTKDLSSRLSSTAWSDFLGGDRRRQNEIVLGLGVIQSSPLPPAKGVMPGRAREFENALDVKLIKANIHCRHSSEPLGKERASIDLIWSPRISSLPPDVELLVKMELIETEGIFVANARGEIRSGSATMRKLTEPVVVTLPVEIASQSPPVLAVEHLYDAFLSVSAKLISEYLRDDEAGDPA